MVKKKVLNLYAGIGGNRKLWKDVEVTAVENNPEVYMYNMAILQNSLGIIYTQLKNYELAEKMYLDAIACLLGFPFKNVKRKKLLECVPKIWKEKMSQYLSFRSPQYL